MNRKLALTLVVILVLIRVSRETVNYASNTSTAADDIVRILMEYPAPEKVGGLIGHEGPPRMNTGTTAQGQVWKQYDFYFPDKTVTVSDREGKISSILWFKTGFGLKRGLSFETLKKMIIDSLAEYFREPPKIVERYVYDSPLFPEPTWYLGEDYAWTIKKKDGVSCEIRLRVANLSIEHVDANSYLREMYNPNTLWLKRGRIEIILFAYVL
jgi:hypothetical protein